MKTALGKGLEALIPAGGTDEIAHIDVERITASRQQPRKVFREETLKELAQSIKEKGIIQPVIVSRGGDGTFRLIAGERRWRAALLAGLKKIPAIIKDAAPSDSLEIALIENIQREDLSPIETANAFQSLLKEFQLTQEQLSERVGKERATVANYLRLLKLPDEVKALINEGRLTMGHARALAGIEDRKSQVEAALKIVSKGLSVREAEALAKRYASPPASKRQKSKDPQIESLEEGLRRSLGTKVRIRHRGKRGSIEIEYYSLDELQRILDILMG
jgi:ParB family chromosome partitioning protein